MEEAGGADGARGAGAVSTLYVQTRDRCGLLRLLASYAPPTPCPVLTCGILLPSPRRCPRIRYGNNIRVDPAVDPTGTAYTFLRLSAYGCATRRPVLISRMVLPGGETIEMEMCRDLGSDLRCRYALSGTDMAYAATPLVVLVPGSLE
eukprot:2321186-Rhodomonas_salina.5